MQVSPWSIDSLVSETLTVVVNTFFRICGLWQSNPSLLNIYTYVKYLLFNCMGLLHEVEKTEVITVTALFDYVQSYMTGTYRSEFTTAINVCSINFHVTPHCG